MKHNIPLISLYFISVGLEGFIIGGFLLKVSSESENAFVFGYSPQRFILAMGVSIVSLILFALGLWSWQRKTWTERIWEKVQQRPTISALFWSSAALFAGGWIGVLLPSYYLGRFDAYYTRLYPLIVWITLIATQTFLPLLLRSGLHWGNLMEQIKTQRPIMLLSLIVLIFFIAFWTFISWSRIGLTPDVDFWNEGGVPILGLQILFAWGVGVLIYLFTKKIDKTHLNFNVKGNQLRIPVLEILLFLLIWAGAVLVWTHEPMRRSYFTAPPIAPNEEYYPFSDAAVYDIGGQYVLIGKGINNGQFTDKPLYMLFLGVLRAIGGQDYMHVITLQILCLAFFPAILYLLGKGIHSRMLGVLVAIMAIFKERNAIAATLEIQVSSSKLLLSELSTALLLAVLSFLVVKWFKEPHEKRYTSLLAGGILGASALLRPNPLLLLPLILFVAIFVYKFHWRQWFLSSVVFILGFALVFSPWTISAKDQNGDIFLLRKINMILRRYKISILGSDQRNSIPDGREGFSLLTVPNDNDLQVAGLFGIGNVSKSAKIQPLNLPNFERFITHLPVTTSLLLGRQSGFDRYELSPSGAASFVPAHFIHNQITAIVILPLTFQFQDLKHTISAPIWDLHWDGRLSPEGKILLFINLSLIALGIAVAWDRGKWAGLVPVIVNIGYYLANAFARTSGSRYLVPADWTIYFYYSLGLVQITCWASTLLGKQRDIGTQVGFSQTPSTSIRFDITKMVGTAVGLFLLGLSLPLAGKVIPPVYPVENKQTTLKTINQLDINTNIHASDLEAFIKQKKARVIYGRALYPRYYVAGKGGCDRCVMIDHAYLVKDYSRLSLTVIGPYNASVVLPLSKPPKNFPNGSSVYVIGCDSGYNRLFNDRLIDALMVIVVGNQENTVYLRSLIPEEFECPMK